MKKTIMIIGGGLLQVPVIHTARKMGYNVIATDYNPDAIGLKDADVPIVMSTRDVEGSVRVAKKQNELTPISAVLTVGTDASMTVAAVANALNLPGIKYEDAEAATNKIKMRVRFREHNVPSPDFIPVWSLKDAKKACKTLHFPVVIKPSDNMGGRGVMRIDNNNEIADAFQFAKSASPSGELIIEENMEGPELSIDAIIYNGEITFTGIADRIIEHPPYFVETGHNMPSAMPDDVIKNACDVMKQGIKALGINIGAAKGDIKITKNGAMIGELAARLSGGFMSTYTFPLSSGVDLMKAAIEVALGHEPGNLEPLVNRVSVERGIITKPGYVRKISGLEDALNVAGVAEIFLNVKVGDRVGAPKSNVEKAGHIIALADTLEQAEAVIAECMSKLQIEILEEPEISMDFINLSAREKFKKTCYVCKSCDGRDCPTGVPGMGGVGTGASFRRNIESLQQYKVTTRLIHDIDNPDTSIELLGRRLSQPVMAAPITGSVTNMGGAMDELEFCRAMVNGAIEAGTIAFVGDGASPDKYKIGLKAVAEAGGVAIPIFKPRAEAEIIKRLKAAEDAGAIAAGMDIDAIVFKTMEMRNQQTGPRGVESLARLISSTKLPFILKGIMTAQDAVNAAEAGAWAIVVSNHGGRVLDEMPGAMDVLESISAAVKGRLRILVDGGFRSGVDIIKAAALGADAVLIGRPPAIAAVGLGARGVRHFFNSLESELKKAMMLAGIPSVSAISEDAVIKIK
ncbi:MAG: alpha-hydroxy-acid oxidizing protein [Leptospirales bacterium]|nr:alpha-hydroxy-acid oxidizing protein [Leptospirales bacterium]